MAERSVSLEQAVIDSLRALPVERQQEVLDFAQFLRRKDAGREPRPNLKGIWAGVHITDKDIEEARHEMWGNFPRDDL